MKTKTLIVLLSLIFIVPTTSCKKIDTTEEVPNCIKRKARKFAKERGVQISIMEYQGNDVYGIYIDGTYGIEYLFDKDCNELCNTEISSQSLNICQDIKLNSINSRVVWVHSTQTN